MSSICIIPARGGSKRIPKKNIIDFFGRPLISYTIETAIKSNLFDRVVVSTDSLEIKRISELYGAEVPFLRSKKNSNDYATTSNVILESIKQLELNDQSICCIYPTAIFCDGQSLINSYEKLIEGDYSTLVPITQFSYPLDRALKINGSRLTFVNPSKQNTRTQDCEKLYHDCGQWYWISRAKEFNSLYTKNTGYYLVEGHKTQDIDSYVDLEIAKIKYEYLQGFKK